MATPEAKSLPDTFLIISGVALLVFALSYFIAPGSFDMIVVSDGETVREVIDPDSFVQSESANGLPLFSADGAPALFNAIFEGLASGSRNGGAVAIMAFILVVGGAFGVLMDTGAVNRGIGALTGAGAQGGTQLLVTLFLVFSLSGAVFGMGEEAIPFVLMLAPMLRRFGYDAITTLLVTYVATQVGFATSWMNPFSVAIAQGIADVPLLSGMPLRIGMWCVFTLATLAFTLRYAATHRVTPDTATAETAAASIGAGDRLVLGGLLVTLIWIIWGVVGAGYYLPEIATQFVVLGVFAGVIGCYFRLDGMDANRAASAFKRGAQDLLPAALVVGFAQGIVYLMGGDDPSSPSILNTLLHNGAGVIGTMPQWLAAWGMFLSQCVFNFFVTSGSGQAALTMPLMAPLADLLGVSRQVAVLAFQLGDGLTNLLVPTSAALMGCLGAAGVDWLAWLRAVKVLIVLLAILASATVILATAMGYQ